MKTNFARPLLVLTGIDVVLIWLYVWFEDPDPSSSLGIIILIPLVIGINLLIAGVLHLTNRNQPSLFVTNSIISSVLMYTLFTQGVNRHLSRRLDTWTFSHSDTLYKVEVRKDNSSFTFSYNSGPGSSTSFAYGKVLDSQGVFILTNETLRAAIKSNYLFGFKTGSDSIKLNKQRY